MRKLSLKKETLADLSADELDRVVGGLGVTQNSQCFCSDFAACFPTYDCTLRDCVATVSGC